METIKKNWQLISILSFLIINSFATGKQIGTIENEIKSQDRIDCMLIEEIKELRMEIRKTNQILYELKGKGDKYVPTN